MVQVSEIQIIVAAIVASGTIIAAVIGTSRYAKRKAEASLYKDSLDASHQMITEQRKYIDTQTKDKESIRKERDLLHEDIKKVRKERDMALDKLDQINLEFMRVKNVVQTMMIQMELISGENKKMKELFCIDAPICINKKSKIPV